MQLVQLPTRGENIFDLLLTNDKEVVNIIVSNAPLGHYDHCVVDFQLVMKCGDYPAVNNVRNIEEINLQPCALSSWTAFTEVLRKTIDHFVPFKISKIHRHKNYPKEVRKLTVRNDSCAISANCTRSIECCIGSISTVLTNIALSADRYTSKHKKQ